MHKRNRFSVGFTIVELLIVIVVIAILAAISTVAYRGIQERTRASEVSSALSQAKKKLELYKVDFSTYPTSGNLASAGITPNDGSFQYTSDGSTFCLTATSGTVSYTATNTTSPTQGGCAGHGQGGVAAVTNLSLNPRGIGASGWFQRLDGTQTDTANVSWGGRNDWHRLVRGTTHGTFRMHVPLSSLQNGQTYAISLLIANPGSSNMTVYIDFCGVGAASLILAPGQTSRIAGTASRATYDNTYRFFDIDVPPGASGILVTEAMITEGSTIYNYADGDSPNWIWNGTANNSSSTGPAL